METINSPSGIEASVDSETESDSDGICVNLRHLRAFCDAARRWWDEICVYLRYLRFLRLRWGDKADGWRLDARFH